MPLEAVEARRLYRQVADQLRALIDSGEYAVGSRLPTERELAEQAARVATKGDIARIDASLLAMENVEHPGEASMVHDRAFHVAIAGSLGNAVLVRVVGELFDQRLNPYFAQLAHYFESPGTWRRALDEHRAVRDAIVARDPEAARDAMRKHLARSQERFAQNFGTEGAAGSPAERGRPARSQAKPANPKAPAKKQAKSGNARRR